MINQEYLLELLEKQLELFLVDRKDMEALRNTVGEALERSLYCLSRVSNKYYFCENNGVKFSPFHSGQYSIFLYYLASELSLGSNTITADKVYCLNKMLNGCDIYHGVRLPKVFCLEHPVGSVLGRANYGERFMFQQGCTVGGNKGFYPKIGTDVWMFANATLIGDSKIGNRVFISAGTYIKDEIISSDSIVFGSSPNLTVKKKDPSYFLNKSQFLIT